MMPCFDWFHYINNTGFTQVIVVAGMVARGSPEPAGSGNDTSTTLYHTLSTTSSQEGVY